MDRYPLQFDVSSAATPGVEKLWSTQVNSLNAEVSCSIAPGFSGPGQAFSPEDFYALALANCYVATFKALAQKHELDFGDLKVDVRLTVDRDREGLPWMSHAHFDIQVNNCDEEFFAADIHTKTLKTCFITRSIKTGLSFEFVVNGDLHDRPSTPDREVLPQETFTG